MMKKFLAAVTAILMLSTLTACGNDDTSAEVIDEITSEEFTQSETSADADTETETETEIETEAETEAESQETDDYAADENLYAGNGYTVKIDSEKWLDASEYVKLISEYAEDTDIGLNLTAEDIQNMNDGMFYHTNGDGTNFNIVCNYIGNTDGANIGDIVDVLKEQYETAGINWIDNDIVEINSIEWLKISVETSMEGVDMKMLQYMALSDGNQYVVTFTADNDKYDSALSDFEEVLNSFKLAE